MRRSPATCRIGRGRPAAPRRWFHLESWMSFAFANESTTEKAERHLREIHKKRPLRWAEMFVCPEPGKLDSIEHWSHEPEPAPFFLHPLFLFVPIPWRPAGYLPLDGLPHPERPGHHCVGHALDGSREVDLNPRNRCTLRRGPGRNHPARRPAGLTRLRHL